ncbi:Zinc finger protein [Smittium culicis]|uniref:Zinc finger protein n=1 Tax=Smittium culicis TaxID=133412 RepID=A0A1R1YM19_9FUNG|nr:Zinc finger protein [Smittium culicis]
MIANMVLHNTPNTDLFEIDLPPLKSTSQNFVDSHELPSLESLGFNRDFKDLKFCCTCLHNFQENIKSKSYFNSHYKPNSPTLVKSPPTFNYSNSRNSIDLPSPLPKSSISNPSKEDHVSSTYSRLSYSISEISPPPKFYKKTPYSFNFDQLHKSIPIPSKSPSNSKNTNSMSYFDRFPAKLSLSPSNDHTQYNNSPVPRNTSHNSLKHKYLSEHSSLSKKFKSDSDSEHDHRNISISSLIDTPQTTHLCQWLQCNKEFNCAEDLLFHLYKLHVDDAITCPDKADQLLKLILDIVSQAGDVSVLNDRPTDLTSSPVSVHSNHSIDSSNSNSAPSYNTLNNFSISSKPNHDSDSFSSLLVRSADQEFKCEWTKCSESKSNSLDLIKHVMSKHMKKQEFKCEWIGCDHISNSLVGITNHISDLHIGFGKKEYVCYWSACKRSLKPFTQRQRIIRHIQMHTGFKPYVCESCDKRFLEVHIKDQHVRTHTGERPFFCKMVGCNKNFATSSALKIHTRTHTGERPYTCSFVGCNKRFAESSNLVKHVRVHTGERPFMCSLPSCSKAFSRPDQLSRHIKIHK